MKYRPGTAAAVRDDGAHVARLLAELAHGRLLGRLAGIHQPGREFDDHLVSRRAKLFLQEQLRPRRLL